MVQSSLVAVGMLLLYIHLPGCTSLKEKRSKIKPVLSRLHREFNLSVSEMARQDAWQETVIGCAIISNDQVFIRKVFQEVLRFTEATWPDLNLLDQKQEIIF
jgi:uncharacterized protein YlxP (DUF503 family)